MEIKDSATDIQPNTFLPTTVMFLRKFQRNYSRSHKVEDEAKLMPQSLALELLVMSQTLYLPEQQRYKNTARFWSCLFVCCSVLLLFYFYRLGRENRINVKAVKLVFLQKVSGVRPVTSRKVSTKEQNSAFQGATEKLITGIKITNVCTLLLKEMQNLGGISNVLQKC